MRQSVLADSSDCLTLLLMQGGNYTDFISLLLSSSSSIFASSRFVVVVSSVADFSLVSEAVVATSVWLRMDSSFVVVAAEDDGLEAVEMYQASKALRSDQSVAADVSAAVV